MIVRDRSANCTRIRLAPHGAVVYLTQSSHGGWHTHAAWTKDLDHPAVLIDDRALVQHLLGDQRAVTGNRASFWVVVANQRATEVLRNADGLWRPKHGPGSQRWLFPSQAIDHAKLSCGRQTHHALQEGAPFQRHSFGGEV